MSNDCFKNRGLRCVLANDRFKSKTEQMMIARKSDDQCPALIIKICFKMTIFVCSLAVYLWIHYSEKYSKVAKTFR